MSNEHQDAMANPQAAPQNSGMDDDGRLSPGAWRWRDILWGFGLTLLALGTIAVIESIAASALGIRTGHPGRLLGLGLIATLIFELCLLAFALWFSVGKYGLPFSRFGFTTFPSWGWLLPLAGIVGSYIILVIYLNIVSALHLHGLQPTSNVPTGLFDSQALVPFAGVEICLVAPIAEESFFRGFLFHGLLGKWFGAPGSALRNRLGFWGAALPSGLLFAAFHAELGLLIPFTCVGMLFAWIFWQSGSLWPNIMTHAGFNLINFSASLATHHH